MSHLYKPRPARVFRFSLRTLLVAVTVVCLGAALMPRPEKRVVVNLKVTKNNRVVAEPSLTTIVGREAWYRNGGEIPFGDPLKFVSFGELFRFTVKEVGRNHARISGVFDFSRLVDPDTGNNTDYIMFQSTSLHVDWVVPLNEPFRLPTPDSKLAGAAEAKGLKIIATIMPEE